MKAVKAVKVAISVVALSSASTASAENLIRYSTTTEGVVMYYDSDTIRRVSGGFIKVWTLWDGSRDKSVRWRTKRVLQQIDCNEMMLSAISFAEYDANVRLLDSGSFDPEMEPAIPGSTGYSLVEAVCAR